MKYAYFRSKEGGTEGSSAKKMKLDKSTSNGLVTSKRYVVMLISRIWYLPCNVKLI